MSLFFVETERLPACARCGHRASEHRTTVAVDDVRRIQRVEEGAFRCTDLSCDCLDYVSP